MLMSPTLAPQFSLKGSYGLSGLTYGSTGIPSQNIADIEPTFCETFLTVEMLLAKEGEQIQELEQGHLCEVLSNSGEPNPEPCCVEPSVEAQDACLQAKAMGQHFCDLTDPALEPCCAHTTREDQDSCLSMKGLPARKLGGVRMDPRAKQIAAHTLRQLHGAESTAQQLFKAYTEEKARLVWRATIEYSVAACLAVLVAAGGWRYATSSKSYAIAPTDEELLE
jgi:hypothetical protein